MNSTKMLYSIAIIISLASTAFALSCKVCNSAMISDCDDPYRAEKRYDTNCDVTENVEKVISSLVPNFKVETPKASGCVKIKYETTNDGLQYINRLCYMGDASNITEYCNQNEISMKKSLKQVSCDFCAGDLCNSATTTGIQHAATFMLFVLLLRIMS